MQQILKNSNPYAPIRKVPLDYNGIQSSAYSIQLEDWCKIGTDIHGEPEYGTKWLEKGVVSGNYLLIPNQEVKEIGKQFMYSMTTEQAIGECAGEGENISLGFAMWNSYDGSRALSFELFLNRLVCMNGMVTKKYFDSYRFKHDPTSSDWQEDLDKVCTLISEVPYLHYLETFDHLSATGELNSHSLGKIRNNYLPKVPVSTWGKIMDKFLCEQEYNKHRGWDLLNASTNILWHNKKQTMADFNMNGYIVQGMCDYIEDSYKN
jgi:hypothetical protein